MESIRNGFKNELSLKRTDVDLKTTFNCLSDHSWTNHLENSVVNCLSGEHVNDLPNNHNGCFKDGEAGECQGNGTASASCDFQPPKNSSANNSISLHGCVASQQKRADGHLHKDANDSSRKPEGSASGDHHHHSSCDGLHGDGLLKSDIKLYEELSSDTDRKDVSNGLGGQSPRGLKNASSETDLESSSSCTSLSKNSEKSDAFCETSTAADYSCSELTTIPEILFEMSVLSELCLDDNDLSSLPNFMFETLSGLRHLSVSGNNLSRLPENISCLRRLRMLNVAQNCLSFLPASVGALHELTTIDFSQNEILELPQEFGQLSALEKLVGYKNQLRHLPRTVGRLEKLKSVDLSSNQLSALPQSFGFLLCLTSLNLSSNQLRHLPESVTLLESLRCLDVSNNFLDHLPDKRRCLPNLRQLYASNNSLESLPTWIEHLPALEELRLENNCLLSFPLTRPFVTSSRNLRVLVLSGNVIRSVSECVASLTKLEWLELGNKDVTNEMCRHQRSHVPNWIWCLPRHFGDLHCLKHIDMNSIRLEVLPESFGELVNLEWLDLGGNCLHDLPESFVRLSSLKYLVLSTNQLEILPLAFGNLSKLEELRLDRNSLLELPESFGRLTQLQVLDLSSNWLTELPVFLEKFPRLHFLNLDENCFRGHELQLNLRGTETHIIRVRDAPPPRSYSSTDALWFDELDETNGPAKEDWEGEDGSGSVDDQTTGWRAAEELAADRVERAEETEEDWDKEVIESDPFADCETRNLTVKRKKRPNSAESRPSSVGTFNFVPGDSHAPRVNKCRSSSHPAPSPPLHSTSYSSPLVDQFEDADEP